MKYNLTEKQKIIARWLVGTVRAEKLAEAFHSIMSVDGSVMVGSPGKVTMQSPPIPFFPSEMSPLVDEGLLGRDSVNSDQFVMKQALFVGVDTDFADTPPAQIVTTLDNPHPPEITVSLKRLKDRFPDEKKVGFLIMRFTDRKPFSEIVSAIKDTAERFGVSVIRADENGFHDNLWENVQTHMHGCSFGIAVYERIDQDQPNPNVGLEVGYMMAMNKPVLLLKDQTVATLQADLAGKLYKDFDPHDCEGTIPAQLETWFRDKGIVVGGK